MEPRQKRTIPHQSSARLIALTAGLLAFAPINSFAAPNKNNVSNEQKQTQTISGTVKDENGMPIIGASISELNGDKTGAITDVNGHFSISVAPGTTIKVVYIGYSPQAFKVKENQTNYDIVLREDQQSLNEVVVIGYGVQKKANLTGSVASINSEKLESRPVSSVSAALAGTMAGVTAIQRSGEPGSQTGSLTIRGKNSINAAAPLTIVDGVPGSMNNIDPQDIESISVLKDAASAAIYGVQAANGVIVITTKKGQNNQKARIDYSGMVSSTSPTAHLNFLGAADYAMLFNEATKNENPNAAQPFSDEDIQKYRDGSDPIGHPNTDWYKEVFKKWKDREATLTTVETFCMEIIHALGKPTVSEFASFTSLSSANAADKINNLVKKGYLNKVQSEEDKRIYYLEVTKKYIDYYNISYQYLKEVMEKLENRFTPEENKTLEKMLRIMSEDIME